MTHKHESISQRLRRYGYLKLLFTGIWQSTRNVKRWCGIAGNQLTGPYIFSMSSRCHLRWTFKKWTASPLREYSAANTIIHVNIVTGKGGSPHFTRNVMLYLNKQFPNRWIGRGIPQNWPPRSPDLNPPDIQERDYVKNSDAAALRKVTRSIVEWRRPFWTLIKLKCPNFLTNKSFPSQATFQIHLTR